MCDAHRNFSYSTVATAPSPAASGLSLVVAAGDGAKFPAVPFNATIWPTGALPLTTNAEIVRVTNISTDTLTIVRQQESSAARTILVGDQIAATITAKTFTDIETSVAGTNGAITGGSITVNTAGVSINLPAYLTTAQSPGAYLTTAQPVGNYQPAGAYLTTARGSTDALGLNTAGTNVTWTADSRGVSINAGGYAMIANDSLSRATANDSQLRFTSADSQIQFTSANSNFRFTSADTQLQFTSANSNFRFASADSQLRFTSANSQLQFTSANSNFAGVGETVGTIGGTDLAMTVNTDGVSIGYAKWITTYANDLTSGRAGVGETVGTTGGTDLAMTVNTDGVSVGYPKWITTYANDLTSGRAGVGETVGTIAGTDLALTANTDGVSIGYPKWITTAALSNHSHGNPTLALTNLSGTTASASDGFTLSLAAGAPGGGATYSGFFMPFYMDGATSTGSTGSLSQLGLQPFTIHNNLSFGAINFIGSATVLPTSAANTWSVRLTNSTQGHSYSAVYSLTKVNLVDLYLFSRGSGVFSSEIESFASTRNSFITHYLVTQGANATLTNTAGGSIKVSQTVSMSISYPMLTSTTATSINAASTYTAWGTGYTTWASTASNSTVQTMSTSAATSVAVASTYPATANWSSWKMIPMNFATSLSPGEYWLGMVRYSSTASSSTFGSTGTGALGTGNSYSVSYNVSAATQTGQITWVGRTNSIVSSLGYLGFASQASMALMPGNGTFTGTYSGSATYVNNLGNPAGAMAFSQINSAVSMFQSWFMMDSNLP